MELIRRKDFNIKLSKSDDDIFNGLPKPSSGKEYNVALKTKEKCLFAWELSRSDVKYTISNHVSEIYSELLQMSDNSIDTISSISVEDCSEEVKRSGNSNWIYCMNIVCGHRDGERKYRFSIYFNDDFKPVSTSVFLDKNNYIESPNIKPSVVFLKECYYLFYNILSYCTDVGVDVDVFTVKYLKSNEGLEDFDNIRSWYYGLVEKKKSPLSGIEKVKYTMLLINRG